MSQSVIESKSANVTNKLTDGPKDNKLSMLPKYKTGDDIGPILTFLRQKIKLEQR